jgi:hypothetical protein
MKFKRSESFWEANSCSVDQDPDTTEYSEPTESNSHPDLYSETLVVKRLVSIFPAYSESKCLLKCLPEHTARPYFEPLLFPEDQF